MPLGVLKLDHFADSIALLELDCVGCDKHRTLRTDELVARHTRFVSIPETKQIGPIAREVASGAERAFLSLDGYLQAHGESRAITMMSSADSSGRAAPLEAPTVIAWRRVAFPRSLMVPAWRSTRRSTAIGPSTAFPWNDSYHATVSIL